MGKPVIVECRISRSAFSGERVFRATLADGKEHLGAASLIYFSKSDGTPLGPDEPPPDRQMKGRIVGRIIKEFDNTVFVSLPDGELAELKRSQVGREVPQNVLVES